MVKREKILAFTLDLMVYPFKIRFSFNERGKYIRKYLSKNGIPKRKHNLIEYEVNAVGNCVVFDDGGYALIRMKRIPKSASDLGSLQHEITHVVMIMLDKHIGMPHNLYTTEAYSYLTGYITQEVYTQLPKFK